MGDFDRNAGRGRSGRGRFDRGCSGGFGGRGRGRDRRSERPEMHSAVCDKCADDCEVPFKPTQGKPIYCDDCFKDKSRESGSRSDFGKQSGNQSKESHDQINKKLDRILNILEGHVKEKEPKLEYAETIEKKKPKKKKQEKKKS